MEGGETRSGESPLVVDCLVIKKNVHVDIPIFFDFAVFIFVNLHT